MVRRHPHVFGEVEAENAGTVVRNWEALKAQERAKSGVAAGKKGASGALSGVPVALPALVRAHRMQEKAARQGVDWSSREAALEECRQNFEAWAATAAAAAGKSGETGKPGEPGNETDASHSQGDRALSDLLWSLVGVVRLQEANAEEALRSACDRFRKCFELAEEAAAQKGKSLADLPPGDRDEVWQRVKAMVG
jgi:tetrapyrrole methylase family protein/MazG family protein